MTVEFQSGVAIRLLHQIEISQAAIRSFTTPIKLAKFVSITTHGGAAKNWRERYCGGIGGSESLPRSALINPRPQETDLLGSQRLAFAGWRHFHVGHQASGEVDEWAFGAVA